ncbi:MAG: hypothetical protein WA209_06870 [Candidatus Acidiferrales bacterium]
MAISVCHLSGDITLGEQRLPLAQPHPRESLHRSASGPINSAPRPPNPV